MRPGPVGGCTLDFVEIGAALRARRQELGLSLQDIQKATKIRLHYLRALEAGDESILPALPYTQGFIRSYANYIGLDAQALATAYRVYRQTRGLERDVVRGGPTPVRGMTGSYRSGRTKGSLGMPPGSKGRRRALAGPGRGLGSIVLGVLVVAAMMLGTVYAIRGARERAGIPVDGAVPADQAIGAQPDGMVDTGPDLPVDGQPDTVADPGPDQGDETTAPAGGPSIDPGASPVVTVEESGQRDILYTAIADKLAIMVAVTDRSWAEVWLDGAKVYEGFFEADESYTYEATSDIRIWAGNPAGLNVSVNGRGLGVPAPTGPRNLIFRLPTD